MPSGLTASQHCSLGLLVALGGSVGTSRVASEKSESAILIIELYVASRERNGTWIFKDQKRVTEH